MKHKPHNKRGQTLVEYALIIAFIAVVAITVLSALGLRTQSTFNTVTGDLVTAKNGGPSGR